MTTETRLPRTDPAQEVVVPLFGLVNVLTDVHLLAAGPDAPDLLQSLAVRIGAGQISAFATDRYALGWSRTPCPRLDGVPLLEFALRRPEVQPWLEQIRTSHIPYDTLITIHLGTDHVTISTTPGSTTTGSATTGSTTPDTAGGRGSSPGAQARMWVMPRGGAGLDCQGVREALLVAEATGDPGMSVDYRRLGAFAPIGRDGSAVSLTPVRLDSDKAALRIDAGSTFLGALMGVLHTPDPDPDAVPCREPGAQPVGNRFWQPPAEAWASAPLPGTSTTGGSSRHRQAAVEGRVCVDQWSR